MRLFQKSLTGIKNFFLFWIPMNFQKDWKAKLERSHFFKVQPGKITVCPVLMKLLYSWLSSLIYQSSLPQLYSIMYIHRYTVSKNDRTALTNDVQIYVQTYLRFLSAYFDKNYRIYLQQTVSMSLSMSNSKEC